MAKCKVWWDAPVSAYRAQFPFKQQVVDFLKGNIPHSDRSWEDSTKTWTFTETYFDGTVKFLRLVYGDQEVAVVSRQQYEQAQAPPRSVAVRNADSNTMMLADFMRLLPYEAAREAYRRAAILLHPDRNKENDAMEKMSKINALWTKIQKEIYGQ